MPTTSRQTTPNRDPTPAPRQPRIWTFANLLTLVRIGLIPPFLLLAHDGRYALALAVFFAAREGPARTRARLFGKARHIA